ncbi:unnamed protein product [Albugo candida]|uniref:60S ribosomal export protein NMD3 OB-fold domain-containing protein n=1 Tax=Albugo candida TaxID=65357 RepID=A0A024G322_9STRA|nr:unnamed protein product [Albugo candida]|eukprot:CCI41061.1 unnamed protein product [Albugo candida]
MHSSQGDGMAYHVNKKMRLVEVEVVRECDLNVNDNQFFAATHLGNVLHVGDTALCYDLPSSVKKFSRRSKKRNWKLQQLKEIHSELPDLLDELENDHVMRGQINIYKQQTEAQGPNHSDNDNEGMQVSSIPLSEMLDDLTFETKSSDPVTIRSVEEASKGVAWELEEL